MDFRPLNLEEQKDLSVALNNHAEGKNRLLINRFDTSFGGVAKIDEDVDEKVVMAVRSIPRHY